MKSFALSVDILLSFNTRVSNINRDVVDLGVCVIADLVALLLLLILYSFFFLSFYSIFQPKFASFFLRWKHARST